jgi:UPF0755 protein
MFNYRTRYKDHPERFPAGDVMPWMLIIVTVLLCLVTGGRFYHLLKKPIVDLHDKKAVYLHIPTGSGFKDVRQILFRSGMITDANAFDWLVRRKHYDHLVKPGRYRITNAMTNNALINLLRSGRQEPVRITLQNFRSSEELAGRIGHSLETDSARFSRLFRDPVFLEKYGVTPVTLFVLFLPDTYEFFWNTPADVLFRKMKLASDHFWSAERLEKAKSLSLSIPEVVTLASILEKETNRNDEKPVMAGVYLNRIRKRIPLQADPTVIYAWGDYSIRRVLKKHTEIRSPYNTYLNPGLPPGPICMPSTASVDAVLNSQHHDFLYFCAKEDLSGYHNFAATLAEHNRNAKKYQAALDKLNIR